MGYLLGVDVGNTKTLYALANEDGAVINVHYGKPANFQSLGPVSYTHLTLPTICSV